MTMMKKCRRYEEKIKSYGKIHLFMGGVGLMATLPLMNQRLL